MSIYRNQDTMLDSTGSVAMTAPETLTAAAEALRAGPSPLHLTLAEWLGDTARGLTTRIAVWESTYEAPPPVDRTITANTEAVFAFPLAVARAVLDGAT
jgi:hypothetical protein